MNESESLIQQNRRFELAVAKRLRSACQMPLLIAPFWADIGIRGDRQTRSRFVDEE
jgi:hypothetical protein